MEQHCPVLQIVGYKNSGKTTLMETFIQLSVEKGLQTATIKHHGHGGFPVNNNTEQDSTRHQQAGAFLSSVEGDGMLSLQVFQEQWTLQKLVQLYQTFHPDIVFVEGYKQADYPKVVLIRKREDMHLVKDCMNVLGVMGPPQLALHYDPKHFYSVEDQEAPARILQKVIGDEII